MRGRSVSLLDVTPARRRSYVAAFILLSLLGYGVVIWRHIAVGPGGATCAAGANDGSVAAIAESLMIGFAIAHAAAFGLALVTAEITGGVYGTGRLSADQTGGSATGKTAERRPRPGVTPRVTLRVTPRAALRNAWSGAAWNRRRREAEARGASFDEPEPYSDDE